MPGIAEAARLGSQGQDLPSLAESSLAGLRQFRRARQDRLGEAWLGLAMQVSIN